MVSIARKRAKVKKKKKTVSRASKAATPRSSGGKKKKRASDTTKKRKKVTKKKVTPRKKVTQRKKVIPRKKLSEVTFPKVQVTPKKKVTQRKKRAAKKKRVRKKGVLRLTIEQQLSTPMAVAQIMERVAQKMPQLFLPDMVETEESLIMQRLVRAEQLGVFDNEARRSALDFDWNLRDVYELWHSPDVYF